MTPARDHAITECAKGTVRGRHVFVLFGLSFFLSLFLAHLLSREADPLYQIAWRNLLWGLLSFLFFVFVTLAVPDLRALFLAVLKRGGRADALDVLLVAAVMLTWGLGASRLLFNYSLVLLDPDLGFAWMNLSLKPVPGPIFMLLGTLNVVLLAPITEEVVFRGYLLNLWLARHRTWFAIAGSSIAFGIWHFKTAPFATGMGFFLALLYLKYRSLVVCVVLHALYNMLMNRLLLGQFFIEKDRLTVADPSSWSTEIALAIAFVPLAWLFWKRFRPQTESNS